MGKYEHEVEQTRAECDELLERGQARINHLEEKCVESVRGEDRQTRLKRTAEQIPKRV